MKCHPSLRKGIVFLNEPRVRASVLARPHPPEPLNFRVADRVVEVFAWQTAWHHQHLSRS